MGKRKNNSYSRSGNGASSHDTSERTRTPTINFPFEPLAAFILIGKTGSGKSSFIKLLGGRDLSGNEPIVDSGLGSCTKKPTVYLAAIGSRKIVLLDTPGFDDGSGIGNLEILNDIAASLHTFALRKNEIQTQGVIFLHDISEVRFTASQQKTLEILRALCGPEGMSNCIIGTTMWSTGSSKYKKEEVREGQFQQEYWQDIFKTTRIPEDDSVAVTGIINDILARPPVLLQIQQEMLKPPHTLEITTVGKIAIPEGHAEVDRLRKEIEDYKRLAREEAEAQEVVYRRQRQEEITRYEEEWARQRLEDARVRKEEQRKREEEQRKREEELRKREEELRKREEEQRRREEEHQKREEERWRLHREEIRQMGEEYRKQLEAEATRIYEEGKQKREADRDEWERRFQEAFRRTKVEPEPVSIWEMIKKALGIFFRR